jgi:hypothetical protein
VKLDASAPDGLIVHSFSGDDPIRCKDYVREKAGLPAWKPNGGNGHKHHTDANIDKAVMSAVMAVQSAPAHAIRFRSSLPLGPSGMSSREH